MKGHEAAVGWLLNENADVNAQDKARGDGCVFVVLVLLGR
jgi:hypothetical protein